MTTTPPTIPDAPRDRIKRALNGVDGITGYASEPANKVPGAGWPVLREVSRDGVFAAGPYAPYTRAYDVFVILPATNAAESTAAAERLAMPLIEALEAVGEWVQPLETVQVAIGNANALPALRVRIIVDPDYTDR